MSTTNRPWTVPLLATLCYLGAAGHNTCSGDILHDSGFDLWCGEALCSWKVERGDVRKAPTWHADDHGVELLGDDVVISQRSDASFVKCVRFDMVADIDLEARVTLEMDLYDDGVVDFERQLPTARWERLEYLVTMPDHFQGIRFRLRKTGPGHAVLAQIRAIDEDECGGEPLAARPGPAGAACVEFTLVSETEWQSELRPDWCASNLCVGTVPGFLGELACGECDGDASCGRHVCGLESRVPPFLDPYRACVRPASRVLGERCFGDAECATGLCCGGACSTCCVDVPCADGRTCGPRASFMPALALTIAVMQCDPQAGRGLPGEACLSADDCASGVCAGPEALRLCGADGRRCDQDPDCPEDGTQEEGEFGTCASLGIAGGICQ
jgi:hypothetical protein